MPDNMSNPTTPQAPQPLVVDSSENCETAAKKLADLGVKVVMRYYSRAHDGGKRLTKREAIAIHQENMAIGLVYQHNAGSIDSFSQAEAQQAADYCISRDVGITPGNSEAIKHPPGTVIYFGIDTNDFSDNDLVKVAKYFTKVRQIFHDRSAPFVLGVYGSGKSCERMRSAAQVDHFWLAGVSTGWHGTRDSYNAPGADWNLFQNALEVPLGGVHVDTNLVNPAVGGKLGAFDKNGLIGSLDDSNVRAKLRFTKASPPALFYEKAGSIPLKHTYKWKDKNHQWQSQERDYIEPRRMVSVLEETSGWSKVEVLLSHNTVWTIFHGYVASSMLTSIQQMP